MKSFAHLYHQLSETTELSSRDHFISSYLNQVEKNDATWAIYLTRGGSLKRLFSTTRLSELAHMQILFSEAIFEACLEATADLIETISLVLPVNEDIQDKSLSDWINDIIANQKHNEIEKSEFIINAWNNLRPQERYIFNRLVTNTLRSPISLPDLITCTGNYFNISLVQQAFNFFNTDGLTPASMDLLKKINEVSEEVPFPERFMEPAELNDPSALGDVMHYNCSCEWNGIRVQWVIQKEISLLWTRRGEIISDKFPEFYQYEDCIDAGTIIDGVLIAYNEGALLPKSLVRKRIRRKRITAKTIKELPVYFCAIDLLQLKGRDIQDLSLSMRHQELDKLIRALPKNNLIKLSDNIILEHWNDIQLKWDELRTVNSRGLILKKKSEPYGDMSKSWFKIKAPTSIIKGILLYVRRGDGGLSNQFIEYTLGARMGSALVPFTKVKASFQDEEKLAIKSFVKDNTIERFGPVYSLTAELVFEISYEAVESSTRHKSGILLKHPQFIKWDKTADIDNVVTLDKLKSELIEAEN